MKKFIPNLATFCLGLIMMFFIGSYSMRDIRYVLSESKSFANGSVYQGALNKQGQLHGYGRLTWKNGDQFEGQFVAGLFQGNGKLISGPMKYEGHFDQGYMNGFGVLIYDNGTRYEGNFLNNQFNGSGKLINIDGSVYDGSFQKGEITGKGKWTFSDKSIYVGEVKNGLFNGKGEWSRANELKYTGDFVDSKMQGNGIYSTGNHETYSGEFSQDKFTGKGTYKNTAGDTYAGIFSNWVLEGAGIKTDEEGNQWQGKFKHGQMNGDGSYLGKDGETYTGEFKYNSYSGKGKLHAKNGDVYEGNFDYGQKDGKGVLIYQEPLDGIKQIRGRWKNDRLVEGDENVKIYSPEEVSDYAIYHQKDAMTQALAAVQPSDPDKIELYSVVVAAYGTQEVFRRESKFIENLFSTQYGNRSTSVYLTNSQRSMNENPLATLTSIKQAILDVANKMDKNKDILFLYITSHGSKDKKISLTHSGLGLGDIDAKWLGEILKSTGIKHKVIVLSACYSGGFIDDLKDDQSIVITSAAADRTSFGCGDDSHFTYFAKAYFKEALASKIDFVAAFYKAKTLVNEWEKSEKQKESNPQIYTAPEVVDYVKKWNINQP